MVSLLLVRVLYPNCTGSCLSCAWCVFGGRCVWLVWRESMASFVDEDAAARAVKLDELRGSSAWSAAVGVVGASLWAQLFLLGIIAEWQFEVPRPWAILAYVIPLGVLFAGVMSRAPVILLTLFAGSLLPGLVLLPAPEKILISEGGSILRIGLTLALFLAVASAGSGEEHDAAEFELLGPDVGGAKALAAGSLRRFVLARLGVLFVLFVVPAYAVFIDADIAAALSRNYGKSPEAARTFLGLVHFFAWSVAAYMMVLVPSLNLEYDHRRLGRRLGEVVDGLTRARLIRRVVLWFAISASVLLVAWVIS